MPPILPPEPSMVARFVGFYLNGTQYDVIVERNTLDAEAWLAEERRLAEARARQDRRDVPTVRPQRKAPIVRYSILIDDLETGEVESDNYVSAAIKAAQELFDRKCARRESGQAGGEGDFVAFNVSDDDGILFTLREV